MFLILAKQNRKRVRIRIYINLSKEQELRRKKIFENIPSRFHINSEEIENKCELSLPLKSFRAAYKTHKNIAMEELHQLQKNIYLEDKFLLNKTGKSRFLESCFFGDMPFKRSESTGYNLELFLMAALESNCVSDYIDGAQKELYLSCPQLTPFGLPVISRTSKADSKKLLHSPFILPSNYDITDDLLACLNRIFESVSNN